VLQLLRRVNIADRLGPRPSVERQDRVAEIR
jgi:hypothetical protein